MISKNMDVVGLIRRIHNIVSYSPLEADDAKDISHVEIRALITIAGNQSCSMRELGEDMVLTRSGVTRLVDRLEKKGFVVRRRSRDDGRVCCLEATEPGMKKVASNQECGRKLLQHAFSCLDPAVQQMIEVSFYSLEQALKEVRKHGVGKENKLKKSTKKESLPSTCQKGKNASIRRNQSLSMESGKIIIRPSRSGEAELIREFLRNVNLPVEDLYAAKLWNFKIAESGKGDIIGTVGIEVCGKTALLRSLAVLPVFRNCGVGVQLTRAMEADSRRKRIAGIYLLTTTAEEFFKKLGYENISRDDVPEGIQATEEFKSICPETAVCMMKKM
jgi:amino-acid N-acetyltransferase